MSNKRRKKTTETSKKLLYITDVFAGSLIIFTYAIIWKTNDTSPLSYLIPAIFGLVTTSHGFYFWKAKAENMKKLGLYDNQFNNTDVPTSPF